MAMTGDITRYISMQRSFGRSAKSLQNYEWRLNCLSGFLQRKTIRDVTAKDLQGFQDYLTSSGKAHSSRCSIITTIRHFFAWAYDNGRILNNPAAGMVMEKAREEKLEMPPSEQETADLLEAVEPVSFNSCLRRAILELMYGCGLRREEVTRIKLEHIDFNKELLLIKGKGNKERVVPVPLETMRYVSSYLSVRPVKGKYLFLRETGSPVDPTYIDNLFGWLKGKTGTTIHAHMLRHAFAVHMLRSGADVRVLQQLLGHSLIDTTTRYLRLVKEDVRAAYLGVMEEIL